jgi:CheY-like chemotaxis protein
MLAAGFNMYLKKPIEPLDLVTAVSPILQRPAQ